MSTRAPHASLIRYIAIETLQTGVVESGTGRRARDGGRPACGAPAGPPPAAAPLAGMSGTPFAVRMRGRAADAAAGCSLSAAGAAGAWTGFAGGAKTPAAASEDAAASSGLGGRRPPRRKYVAPARGAGSGTRWANSAAACSAERDGMVVDSSGFAMEMMRMLFATDSNLHLESKN